jgi:hypothetical protein
VELVLDKANPHLIRLPNRVQVALRFGSGDALVQDAVKKYEGRDALVRGTMNKYATVVERVHDPAKSAEIL